MNLMEYVDYCQNYNGQVDKGLEKQGKAVSLFVESFGFRVVNRSRNFVQLVKVAGEKVLWVQFNYGIHGGEFWSFEGDTKQLEGFMQKPRLIQNDELMIAEAGIYQFHKMKGDIILSVYRTDTANPTLVDCYEEYELKDDYLTIKKVCENWMKQNQSVAV